MELRADLFAATRHAHQSLERLMQLDADATATRYSWYLVAMHAVIAAAEAAMTDDPRLEALGLAMGERRKLAWLESDLLALGLDPAPRHFAPEVPADAPRRVGWAYVLEGSTLGARVMLRHTAPRLDVTQARGTRFLAGYGDRTAAMWRSFVEALDAIPFDAVERKACIAGAAQAFTAIAETFRAISIARPHLGIGRQDGGGLAA